MAELGLPAGGNIGYEAFNKEEGLGTSNPFKTSELSLRSKENWGERSHPLAPSKVRRSYWFCLAASSSADNSKSRAPLSC